MSKTNTRPTLEGHSSEVYSVASSHDSTRLASASGDRTIKVWDDRSGECLLTPKFKSNNILRTDISIINIRT
jgi:WD40 repeat protein